MKKILLAFSLLAIQSVSIFAQETQKPIVLPLEGAINFRDIGGYTTTTGKKVLTDKIFRSAEISTLTDKDLNELAELHITNVIDFRGTDEAKKAPDKLPKGAQYYLCPAGSENVANGNYGDFLEKIKNNDNSFLMDFYGEKGVQYFGDRYRVMFDKLLNTKDNEAILYHCTAGRDRTGMATALIYYILQVPMETIEKDYVASNIYLKEKKKIGDDNSEQMYATMAKATGLSKETLEERMALKPEYIRAFFKAINTKYGSVENFLKKEMNITSADIKKLRQKYTK
ncbi:MAG: tyrosine-protein phosphatase [Flavobacteriaceae bacterium]|jgi:protein-tyrosine phosphatase|nr:tyrosine-protein phosphatase [Flavobacteriaceae bacterium]